MANEVDERVLEMDKKLGGPANCRNSYNRMRQEEALRLACGFEDFLDASVRAGRVMVRIPQVFKSKMMDIFQRKRD